MNVFPADDLVWLVFYEPGARPRPVVILAGQGAQALADDIPQLSSILDRIGVRKRRLEMHSRHAEALLLHVAEPALSSSDTGGGVEHLRRAVELAPDQAGAWTALGIALGMPDEVPYAHAAVASS